MVETTTKGRFAYSGVAGRLARSGRGGRGGRGGRDPCTALGPRCGPEHKAPRASVFFRAEYHDLHKKNNSLLKKHEMKHRENKNASPKKHEKS